MVTTETLVEVDFLRRRVVRLEKHLGELIYQIGQLRDRGVFSDIDRELDNHFCNCWKAAIQALQETNVTRNLRQAGIVFSEPDEGDGHR